MKKNPTHDVWSDSGLFKSQADFNAYLDRTRKKLKILRRKERKLEAIRNNGLKIKKSPTKRHIRLEDYKHDQQAAAAGKDQKSQEKKRPVPLEGPDPPPETPTWLRDVIEELGGHGERLIVQKYMTASDVKSDQSRLSMPVRKLSGPDDFLTEEEMRDVWGRKENDDKRIKGIDVPVFVSRWSKSELSLRKWDLGNSIVYVFAGKWKDFVRKNAPKKGDVVQIRFFRSGDGKPCFAFVNVTAEMPSSSSRSSSAARQNDQPSTDAMHFADK